MDIFRKLAHEEQKCVIVVSHSEQLRSFADRVYTLKNQGLLEK
jgi:putative ABC transport system ATP-binding protein